MSTLALTLENETLLERAIDKAKSLIRSIISDASRERETTRQKEQSIADTYSPTQLEKTQELITRTAFAMGNAMSAVAQDASSDRWNDSYDYANRGRSIWNEKMNEAFAAMGVTTDRMKTWLLEHTSINVFMRSSVRDYMAMRGSNNLSWFRHFQLREASITHASHCPLTEEDFLSAVRYAFSSEHPARLTLKEEFDTVVNKDKILPGWDGSFEFYTPFAADSAGNCFRMEKMTCAQYLSRLGMSVNKEMDSPSM